MEKNKLKAILESLLFISPEPLTISQMKKILDSESKSQLAPKTDIENEMAFEESEPIEEGTSPEVDQGPSEVILEASKDEEDESALNQLKDHQESLDQEITRSEIKEMLEEIVEDYRRNPAKGFELVAVAKGYQFRTKIEFKDYAKHFYKLPKPRLSTPAMETLSIVAYQQPLTRLRVEEIRGVDSGGVLKTLLDRDLVRIVGRSDELGKPILYGTSNKFLETFSLKNLAELPTLKDLDAIDDNTRTHSVDVEKEEDEEDEEDGFIFSDLDSSAELDDESSHLINELEDSMKNLKDLEKNIFHKDKEEDSL